MNKKILHAFLLTVSTNICFGFGKKMPSQENSSTLASSSESAPITDFSSISEIAVRSSCAGISWKGRGKAPIGYIEGMALVYEKNFCDLKARRAPQVAMAAPIGPASKDAIAYLGLNSDSEKVRMRNLFTLLIGLGMRESSGQYCEGTDASASGGASRPSNEIEAGLFQSSYNSVPQNSERRNIYLKYKQDGTKCFKSTFAVGVKCKASMLQSYGTGEGRTFQEITKDCPAFATEHAALNLRVLRAHYGPVNRREVQVMSACSKMLEQIEAKASCN